MAVFNEVFIPLPTSWIAICREHCRAVTAKSIISHINSQHRHITAQVHRRIVEEASALRDDGLLAADVRGIRFPNEVVPAIDGLPVWSDGKKCVQCAHIRRRDATIRQPQRS
ncbi:hypothetical protein N657DRAFT_556715, partial [Parathielavia appendiculata]